MKYLTESDHVGIGARLRRAIQLIGEASIIVGNRSWYEKMQAAMKGVDDIRDKLDDLYLASKPEKGSSPYYGEIKAGYRIVGEFDGFVIWKGNREGDFIFEAPPGGFKPEDLQAFTDSLQRRAGNFEEPS